MGFTSHTIVEKGTGLQAFFYTAEQVQALERTLSAERLQPYRALAHGDPVLALKLHARNTALSESLYGVLGGLEIALRNSVHGVLSSGLGRSDWYDSGLLQPEQQRPLQMTKKRLLQDGKPLDPGRIVAELSFGFWTGLIGPGYSSLWRDHLFTAFSHRNLRREEAHSRLDTIRKLRNRIAHYEPILSRPLQKDYNRILDAIGWISPIHARWVRTYSSFPERYAAFVDPSLPRIIRGQPS
jgi:hypothetical protein